MLLNSNKTINVDDGAAADDLTISGGISGSGYGLIKTGSGTLLLTGTNTYSGSTTLSAGMIEARTPAALPSYSTSNLTSVAGGATLAVNVGGTGEWTATNVDTLRNNAAFSSGAILGLDTSDGSFTYSSSIGGGLGVTKLGGNNLYLSGANSYTGPTTISGGTLQIGNALALQYSTVAISSSTAVLNLNGYSATLGGLSGAGNIALPGVALSVGNNSATTTYSGNLSGSGSLTKIGGGELTLAGSNSYTGSTIVGAGTLLAKTTAALPGYNASAKVSASSGAVLAVSVGGSNEWTAANVDTLRSNATLPAGSLLGFDTTDGNFTYSSSITGAQGLAKLGAGLLDLTGTNSYGGNTSVSNGILQAKTTVALCGTSTFSMVSVANGAFVTVNVGGAGDWQQSDVDALRLSALFASGAGLGLDASDGNFTYSSTIGGTIGIGKFGGGTVLLSGSNTYTGLTTIASGTLQLGNAAALQDSTAVLSGGVLSLNGYNATLGGLSGSGNLSIASGTLTVGNNAASTTYSGTLSGGGALAKIGGGDCALFRQQHVQRSHDNRRRYVANRRRRKRRRLGQHND